MSHPTFLLVSASLLLGLLLLWLSHQFHLVLYASGSCQLLILVLIGPSTFIPYYSIYLLALLGIYWSSTGSVSSLFAFLRLGALPPLTMFWAKVLALSSLPFISSVLVIFISLLTLWPYVSCSLSLRSRSRTSLLHRLLLITYPLFLVSLY